MLSLDILKTLKGEKRGGLYFFFEREILEIFKRLILEDSWSRFPVTAQAKQKKIYYVPCKQEETLVVIVASSLLWGQKLCNISTRVIFWSCG